MKKAKSSKAKEKNMKKECCDIKITETKNGYRLEITGDGVKDKYKSFFMNCCESSDSRKELIEKCCPPKK